MFAKSAFAVATTFHGAASHFAGCRVVRTGLPVREDLRVIAGERREPCEAHVLVVGGSQGSAAINEAALGTAQRMTCPEVKWLHQTGKAHFESIFRSMENLGIASCYEVNGEGLRLGLGRRRTQRGGNHGGTGCIRIAGGVRASTGGRPQGPACECQGV